MEGLPHPAADHGAWDYEPATGRARWSAALYSIHGVSRDEFTPGDESIKRLVHPDDWDGYAETVEEAIESQTPFACQVRIVRPDGEERQLTVRGSFVEGTDGEADRLIGTTQDVTGLNREREQLWHMANHDSLSGLFNRRRFMEELNREVAVAARTGADCAVVMIDLDNFKDVNDSLGHMAGDSLLSTVASELRSRLRATDALARLGGDEFAIVLPACDADAARAISLELLAAVSEKATVSVGGPERQITGSIGVSALDPGRPASPDDLLFQADLAMYKAKANGRGRVEVFDEEMRASHDARVSTEGELREAIGGQELRVQYQPIVAIGDGSVAGCEALLRWEHPVRGTVGPSDFVSIAEESGLISKIGRFVLESACRQARRWRLQEAEVFVSVNISPLQLTRADLVDDVARAIASSGLPPNLLCLEIAETSLLRDTRPLLATLSKLKALGVRLAIDDFGGDAASLGLLRLLPIDVIKIDRRIVASIAEPTSDRALVGAVIDLARERDISVVAGGVEKARQRDEMNRLGAGLAQGFLYSPARDAADLDLSGFEGSKAGCPA